MRSLSFFLMLAMSFAVSVGKKKPHIIIFLADDLGWDDVSFHGSPQIPTPYLDHYAKEGVILNNYYVSPMCTPTRASLMTGKHPIHLGLHHFVIFAAQPAGLPLNEVTIANYLKEEGYKTHAVGKWHLGFFKKEYTPNYRGFDTFYGYWNSKDDYWDHTSKESGLNGRDLRDNMKKVKNETETYGPELFTRKAIERIQQHDSNQPMFLYVAQQAVHSANEDEPLQAPAHLIKRFRGVIDDPKRQVYAAMVTALDHSFGDIMAALRQKDMLKDSIVIFSTDNGGAPYGFNWNMGSNYPLRGGKDTLWEGGVKGAAFVYSHLIKKKGRVCKELIDVSDWVPTLIGQAGGDLNRITKLDGKDVWDAISKGTKSPRIELLHNIDPRRKFEAVRYDKWKLIVGMEDWYSDIGWHPRYKGATLSTLPRPKFLNQKAVIDCGPWPGKITCSTKNGKACLFDIRKDPCEYHDLSGKYPAVVKRLKDKLDKHRKTMKPVWFPGLNTNRANPKAHGGFWDYWRSKSDVDEWLIRENHRRLRIATSDEPVLQSDFKAEFFPPAVQRAMMGFHNETLGHMFHYHYHKNFPVHIPNVGELRTMKYRLAHSNLQKHTTFLYDKIQQKASRLKSDEYRPLKAHELPFHVPDLVSGTKARKVPKKLPLKKANNHKVPHKKRTQAITAKMRPKRPQNEKNPESLKIYKVHPKTQEKDHKNVVSEETEHEDFDNDEDTVDSDDSADSYQQQATFVPPYQAPQFQNQPTSNPWVYNASNGWPSHNTSYVNYG